MSRREQIEAMLAGEPHDTFLNYALALELEKEGEFEQSLVRFESLMNFSPPYVPAYFMAGQMLARLDRQGEAKEILLRGVAEAKQQGDAHAAAEMSEFIQMLSPENDD